LCEYFGCTDESGCNFDEVATLDDGSCVPIVEGCMNSDYLEYNPAANVTDGSCFTLLVLGCMDEAALNYNE